MYAKLATQPTTVFTILLVSLVTVVMILALGEDSPQAVRSTLAVLSGVPIWLAAILPVQR